MIYHYLSFFRNKVRSSLYSSVKPDKNMKNRYTAAVIIVTAERYINDCILMGMLLRVSISNGTGSQIVGNTDATENSTGSRNSFRIRVFGTFNCLLNFTTKNILPMARDISEEMTDRKSVV